MDNMPQSKSNNIKILIKKIKSFDVCTLRVMVYSIMDESRLTELVTVGENYIKAKEIAKNKEK